MAADPTDKRTLASSLLATGSSLLAAAVTVCAGCFAPIAFASLGAFGSVMSTWAVVGAELEPYRPYLLGVSVVLLGVAHWTLYGRRLRSSSTAGAACDIRVGRTARVSLWLATAVTLVAFAAPYLIFRYVVL